MISESKGVQVRSLFPNNSYYKYDLTIPELPDLSSKEIQELIDDLSYKVHLLKSQLPIKEAVERGWKPFLIKSTTLDHHNGDIDSEETLVLGKDFDHASKALEYWHTIKSVERV